MKPSGPNLPAGDWIYFGIKSGVDSVNLWGFYAIGGNVRRLNVLTGDTKLSDAHIYLTEAEIALNFLLYDPAMVPLIECHGPGFELCTHITQNIKRATETPQDALGQIAVSGMKAALDAFDIILRNTLAFVPAYCVTPKGILSSAKLVNNAEEMFSAANLARMSKIAVTDVQAAGRCLAFNLPTSSGFHIIRSLEAVVVDYIVRKTGAKPPKRDLGAYVDVLKKEKASDDVVFLIDQIRRLHRNPLMHPEDVLNADEAMDLFLLCRSAINTTLADMESKRLFEAKEEKAITVPNGSGEPAIPSRV
ncbi:MAG: hypothetical protein ABIR71_06355 [Chthoniobacterales bacterium]